MTRVLKITMAMATAVLLSACGGDGNGTTENGGGETATLSAIDNAFQPAALTVAAGAELEFTNEGQALHNLTIEGTDVNEDLEAGESTTIPLDIDAGEYTMFCEYHRAVGMEGTITVQ
jgi:plastocyanin